MELYSGIRGFELPDNFLGAIVSRFFPGSDMGLHDRHFWYPTIKTLPLENTESDFRHIEPASVLRCVMNFEPFRQPPRLLGSKAS